MAFTYILYVYFSTFLITFATASYFAIVSAIAFAFIMTNSGGILSTWLMGSLSAPPKFTKGTIVMLIFATGIVVGNAINMVYISHQNKLKAKKRETMKREDEPAGLGNNSAWFIYSM